MDTITLTRDEALDIFVALRRAEEVADRWGDIDLLFVLDGAVRILFDKLFSDMPSGDDEEGDADGRPHS